MSSFDQPLPPYNASDPSATFLSTSCLDFLMIELVPMAYRVANELENNAAEQAAIAPAPASGQSESGKTGSTQHNNGSISSTIGAGAGGGVAPGVVISPPPGSEKGGFGGGGAAGSITAASSTSRRLDEDEERDAVFYRLETLGYRVGLGLVERFSRDRPRFNDTLDAIKFVCKDLWTLVFKKQVDNLKTNHRGVYVLTDNLFRPLARMSTDTGGQAVVRAQPFLWFPCGILRGALAAMGIQATVQAESSEIPGAVFQIKTIPAKQ
ncbi:transport protein particle component [Microdochium bolleyi]|uniref:Transport protein particle component n=1 Tax=Microdochium bolleyi TaxID=196109 RepID=A0A136JK72_9PEZI|nr:transport protein particle component [Microdochium bolleyi]